MDDYVLFDPNDSEEISRRKIEEFYGEFSDMIRSKLLSKRVVRPQNAYDILYPKTRESLLSKNKEFNFASLDRTSKEVREFLLLKNKEKETDLLSISEFLRKSLVARNAIMTSQDGLLEYSETIRKNALSKQTSEEGDLLSNQEGIRKDNISRNKSSIQTRSLEDSSEDIRNSLLSKNTIEEGNLSIDSQLSRENVLSKNKNGSTTDLVQDSEATRKSNVAKNRLQESNLEQDSIVSRKNQLSKNVDSEVVGLIDLFNHVRNSVLANNSIKEISLEKISQAFREALISKNKPKDQESIEDFSKIIRENLLSKNSDDIDEDKLYSLSESIRKDLISRNKNVGIDIESLFYKVRENLLSKNTSIDSQELDKVFENARVDLLSKNKSGNLLGIDETSPAQRNVLLSKNKPGDNEDLSKKFDKTRSDLLGKNKEIQNNFESTNDQARKDLIGRNKSLEGTPLIDSESDYRKSLLGKNVIVVTDLLDLSSPFRLDLLGKNKPRISDLVSISSPFREDLLGKNKSKVTDLEDDSVPFRKDVLAKNVLKTSDIEGDSIPFRKDVLAKNVLKTSDIEGDSIPFRKDVLAKNVLANFDLLDSSDNFRKDVLAKNENKFDGDLKSESNLARNQNVAKNIVPKRKSLAELSKKTRENVLAKNVENIGRNLLRDSKAIREYLLSRNQGFGLLGINISAAGTSAFLGISKVLVQGTLYRKILLSKNKITKMAPYVDVNGKIQQNITTQPLEFKQFSVNARDDAKNKDAFLRLNSIENQNSALRVYGNGTRKPNELFNQRRDGKMYGPADSVTPSTIMGTVTDAIRRYNIEKNFYNLTRGVLIPGGNSGYGSLLSIPSINELVQYTIGSFDSNNDKVISSPVNPSPQSIQYLQGEPDQILRPIVDDFNPSSTVNIVQHQGIETNPFDDTEFRQGKKGVRRIVNAIKNNKLLPFAKNLDVQKSKVYIVGAKSDGSPKFQNQRYTVDNPYAPSGAKKLSFYLKNHANGKSMFFPPYINSFSHSSSVNWNTVNFLGRPEAMYTYNNSSRKGSVSFFVLTDYAEVVNMGYKFNDNGNVEVLTQDFDNINFTDGNFGGDPRDQEVVFDLQSKIQGDIGAVAEVDAKIKENAGGGETAVLQKQKQDILQSITNARTRVWELATARGADYSEGGISSRNVYNDLLKEKSYKDGYIYSTVVDTMKRIDTMKSNLMFQPSYFSGSKVDFLNRIEFLEKMTRPSRNKGENGFSFIKPPVCHMHLGDWFNHDIIINSIDYDYADAPWTTDDKGRVQPMWVSVSINFDIVGIYRHVNGPALTADDEGGFFSDLKSNIGR